MEGADWGTTTGVLVFVVGEIRLDFAFWIRKRMLLFFTSLLVSYRCDFRSDLV